MRRDLSMSLFWRVCLINGSVRPGTTALVLSPATVSTRPVMSELVVLVVGLTVTVVVNALLLRTVLAPLDRWPAPWTASTCANPNPPRRGRLRPGPPARRLNAMLERLENERATSTARALRAQEAERQRIAQELHDEVGQSLTAVLLDLRHTGDAEPSEVAEAMERARGTTRTCLEEVRRISSGCDPGCLPTRACSTRSAASRATSRARTGMPVTRGFVPGLPPLTPESELVVYRVAQEALTNVVRHARATSVSLGLARVGDNVVLTVTDDGTGGADVRRGTGIHGMHERAQMVGGHFTVAPPLTAAAPRSGSRFQRRAPRDRAHPARR